MASGDSKEIVDIDGSVLEGGGQILRNAAAFSALLGVPIRVSNIRAGRDKPGLRPQHLSGLELIRDLCNGTLENGCIGSTEIVLKPGKIKGGQFHVDTKTAGSIVLLMQTAVPCVLFASKPCQLTLKGGTNAEKAPPIDYFVHVFQPIAEKFGVKIDLNLVKRGFYPRGGGEVNISVTPVKSLMPIQMLDRGHLVDIKGVAWIAGLPPKIAKATAETAKAVLHSSSAKYVELKESVPKIDVDVCVENERSATGNGNGVLLVCHTSTGCRLAGDSLGRKGISGEQVGRSAAEMLFNNLAHHGCVDDYLQDQLIIFMALAEGKSQIRTGPLTLHTKTAIFVAELLTKVKFIIKDSEDGLSQIIECTGIGLKNSNS